MKQQVFDLKSATARHLDRARERFAMEASRAFFKRNLAVMAPVPLISFSFDDFPQSAFFEAGAILGRYGLRGTYYASLGLMGKQSPTGPMFKAEDLKEVL